MFEYIYVFLRVGFMSSTLNWDFINILNYSLEIYEQLATTKIYG